MNSRSAILSLILVSFGGALLAAEATPREQSCRLSSKGCVTTFLVTGPLARSRAKPFNTDHLAAFGGEARAQPKPGLAVAGEEQLRWDVFIGNSAYVSLTDRCRPLGQSTFYLSCNLRTNVETRLRLRFYYAGHVKVWIDHRPVLSGQPSNLPWLDEASGAVRASKARPLRCLIKLGSHFKSAGFYFQVVPDDEKAVVKCSLPLGLGGAEQGRDCFLRSLDLMLLERFLSSEKTNSIFLGTFGGAPEISGQVGAALEIKDRAGKKVAALQMPPASATQLGRQPCLAQWDLDRSDGSPYFDFDAAASLDGRDLGHVAKRFYSRKGIEAWHDGLSSRRTALAPPLAGPVDTLAALHLEKAQILRDDYVEKSYFGKRVVDELECAEALLTRRALPTKTAEPFERAYLSEIDGSPQPYYIQLPEGYRPEKTYPCIVYLHGYTPTLNKINWQQLPYGLQKLAAENGYLIVMPFARSNTDFQGVGEEDVLRVLDIAKRDYPIDEDRVFLLGYSMGGTGAYTIAAHYPHLWAGVVPLCGRADFYLWKGLDREKVQPYKRFLIELEYADAMAGNFLHVPVHCFQGENDSLVRIEQSRNLVAKLKRIGAPIRFTRIPDEDHWIGDAVFADAKVIDWMNAQRRNRSPRRIRYKTYSIKYNTCYWAQIVGFGRWGQPAELEAEIREDGAIEVTTSNVAKLAVSPPSRPADGETIRFLVNGAERSAKARQGKCVLTIGAASPADGLVKTPSLCGPAKEVYNSRFIIVYGDDSKALAERAAKEWHAFAKGPARLKPHDAVTAQDIEHANLILFGRPKENAILRKIVGRLPVGITDSGFEVGARRFSDPDLGLIMIYPNPLNPRRYVQINVGAFYGEKLSSNHKYDFLPDFIIFHGSKFDTYDQDNMTNTARAAGFFGTRWQLDERATWFR